MLECSRSPPHHVPQRPLPAPERLEDRGQNIEVDAPCGVSTLRTLGRGGTFEIDVADMERGTDAFGVTLTPQASPCLRSWCISSRTDVLRSEMTTMAEDSRMT